MALSPKKTKFRKVIRPSSVSSSPVNPFDDDYEKFIDDLFSKSSDKKLFKSDSLKCECGSDTVYGEGNTFHSTYCPKYNADKKP